MTTHQKCCGTCEWFEPMGMQAPGVGSCLVNPPVAITMQVPKQVQNPKALVDQRQAPTQMVMETQLQGVQPPTHASRRCGKWSLNPELRNNGQHDVQTIQLPASGTFGATD
jgi:hypothetical protein